MTYHQFNPSTDTLEVGTKFDLAGTKGEIIDIDETPNHWPHNVWIESDPDADTLKLDLTKFPGLLIEDKPTKPLTIDKRVKGALVDIYNGPHDHETTLRMIYNYLNSLKET